MKNKKWIPYVFISIQFLSIVLIFLSGQLKTSGIYLYILGIPGFSLGVWAIRIMKIGSFKITPDVKPDSELVERGPYKVIRHPMYLSLIMVMMSVVLEDPSLFRFMVLAVLTVNMVCKLIYEEKVLMAHLKEYPAYMQRTRRLIPFVY
jgi:protein-S-isoprenylcysteine O-methyltransferase Ste14